MISTLLLGSALAAGQAPAALPYGPPATPYYVFNAQGQPVPAPAPAAAPAANGAAAPAANGNGCCEEKKEEEEKPETKYFLEKLLEGSSFGQTLACRGIKVRGWTAMNYSFSSANTTNLPITFNDRPDFFQLNQNWVEVQKDIDTSKKEFQTGYRVSWIAPGTDYRFTLPRGLWNDQLARGDRYGFDPVYHYGTFFLPDLGGQGTTVWVGRFPTINSYELIDAANTPFLTKSYVYQYNPFTHTGAIAITQLNDDWQVWNGLALGSDVYVDPAAQLQYLGSLRWAPKDGCRSVALNAMVTNPRFLPVEAFAHYNTYNLVFTQKIGDRLTYVLDSAFSHISNTPAGGSAIWYGFANYFLYQVTDKLNSNLRVELFEDEDGFRTGSSGLFTALTYGLTYTPADALILRPWVRYDYHSDARPWDGSRDVFTGGIEAIVRW